MTAYLQVLFSGIAVGSIYALAAMGLTLTYKTSGVFNFAQGAVACAAAYFFYELHIEQGWAWPLAFVVTLVIFGVVVGIAMEWVARGVSGATPVQRITATIGILLIFTSGCVAIFGPDAKSLVQFLGTGRHKVGGAYFSTSDVVTALITLGATAALSIYFRRPAGIAMRGVVDDTNLLDLTGQNPTRVRRRAWIIGSSFAALSGMLIAPALGVNNTLLTLLVVHSFGACAIGGFSSLPLTYAGGLIVGVGEQLVQHWTAPYQSLAQLYPDTSFIILFLVLLFAPKGRLKEVGGAVKRTLKPRPAPSVARSSVLGVIGFGFLALIPALVGGTHISAATTALASVILYLSLALLVRVSGQVSLGHIALQGAGAALYGHAVSHAGLKVFNLGLPWPLALLITGLLAVPLGLIVALPAVRLSGTFLALATLGFGLLLQGTFFTYGVFFGKTGGLPTPPPPSADGRYSYYYAAFAVVVVCAGLVVLVERSRLGRLLRALSDSQTALTSLGTSVDVARTMAFALSAFLAGVSGAVQGGVTGQSNEYGYEALASLGVIAILAISAALAGVARGGTVATAVVAGAVFTFLPTFSTDSNPDAAAYFQIGFGAVALLVAIFSEGRLSASLGRLTGSTRERSTSPVRARAELAPAARATA